MTESSKAGVFVSLTSMGVWTVFRVSASKPNIIILEQKRTHNKEGGTGRQRVIKKGSNRLTQQAKPHISYKAHTLGAGTDQGRKASTHIIVVPWIQKGYNHDARSKGRYENMYSPNTIALQKHAAGSLNTCITHLPSSMRRRVLNEEQNASTAPQSTSTFRGYSWSWYTGTRPSFFISVLCILPQMYTSPFSRIATAWLKPLRRSITLPGSSTAIAMKVARRKNGVGFDKSRLTGVLSPQGTWEYFETRHR